MVWQMNGLHLLFLALFCWGDASGRGVWNGKPAHHWQVGSVQVLREHQSLPAATPLDSSSQIAVLNKPASSSLNLPSRFNVQQQAGIEDVSAGSNQYVSQVSSVQSSSSLPPRPPGSRFQTQFSNPTITSPRPASISANQQERPEAQPVGEANWLSSQGQRVQPLGQQGQNAAVLQTQSSRPLTLVSKPANWYPTTSSQTPDGFEVQSSLSYTLPQGSLALLSQREPIASQLVPGHATPSRNSFSYPSQVSNVPARVFQSQGSPVAQNSASATSFQDQSSSWLGASPDNVPGFQILPSYKPMHPAKNVTSEMGFTSQALASAGAPYSGQTNWFKVTRAGFTPDWDAVRPYRKATATNNPYAYLEQIVAVASDGAVSQNSGQAQSFQPSSAFTTTQAAVGSSATLSQSPQMAHAATLQRIPSVSWLPSPLGSRHLTSAAPRQMLSSGMPSLNTLIPVQGTSSVQTSHYQPLLPRRPVSYDSSRNVQFSEFPRNYNFAPSHSSQTRGTYEQGAGDVAFNQHTVEAQGSVSGSSQSVVPPGFYQAFGGLRLTTRSSAQNQNPNLTPASQRAHQFGSLFKQ